jgi:Cd2+/Zn2+-exporting ATPase
VKPVSLPRRAATPAPWSLRIQASACVLGTIVGASLEGWYGIAAGWTGVVPGIALVSYLGGYLGGCWHPAEHAWHDLQRRRVNIDLLTIAAAWGSAALGHWADGGALLVLFSLSHVLESIILGRTRRAISDMLDLSPDEAWLIDEHGETRVPVERLVPGDRVLVRPSERIPADGVIREGTTSVDESPVNGESLPIDKGPGERVFAGTLNQQGVIRCEVTAAAAQSTLARMVQLVEEAQAQRADSQRFTEWFGERYTWVVLGLALATLTGSRLLTDEDWGDSLYRMMTVLVVASPCAVVISIPAAILAGIASAARGGVLFKGGSALERAATLKGMAFDKTGTLTLGQPRVVSILPAEGVAESDLLRTAAALERHSEHPLAKAIVAGAQERGLVADAATDVQAIAGAGVVGTVGGRIYRVGKLTWFVEQGVDHGLMDRPELHAAMARGESVVGVMTDVGWLGGLTIADTMRPTTEACLRELRAIGVEHLLMLTGDAIPVAEEFGRRLRLEVRGALLPGEKRDILQAWRAEVGPVGMIGDGLNDAPSLAAADLGVSLGGSGTDVALETADVVIVASDLRRLPYALRLARRTRAIIRQNLLFAFGTMAVLLLTTLFVRLPLPLAVLCHEGSTLLVILNGVRLLRFPRV